MPTPLIWPVVPAAVPPGAPVPDADAALGLDIDTFAGDPGSGLDPLFGQIAGAAAVAQCVARRLLNPRGILVDAQDVGIDLRSYLNEAMTASMLAQIRGAVVGEASADERVLNASADVTFDAPSQTLTVEVQGETADGPFELVLAVSALTVTLLQANPR